MDELSEYDNLIRAMGALFYTSKRMSEAVPCIFQAWKETAFENRARRIRNLLSESKNNKHKEIMSNDSHMYDMKELGSQGMTINYDG